MIQRYFISIIENKFFYCNVHLAVFNGSGVSLQELEVVKAAEEFNLPIIRANRKLVASENGGLHNPSYLVFDSVWHKESVPHSSKKFSYPNVTGVRRPISDEDIAFMSVCIQYLMSSKC